MSKSRFRPSEPRLHLVGVGKDKYRHTNVLRDLQQAQEERDNDDKEELQYTDSYVWPDDNKYDPWDRK